MVWKEKNKSGFLPRKFETPRRHPKGCVKEAVGQKGQELRKRAELEII